MNIQDIQVGDTVYFPKIGRRVTVKMIDEKRAGYVYVVESNNNSHVVHCSNLEPIIDDNNMSIDDIVKREG